MGTPNKDYRENPKRAVYVVGRVGQELIDKLTPQINELRHSSSDPITAYIDSPGGYIPLAELLRDLIRTPHPDGQRCRLITVVTGNASSAAADFCALGDYAIAYEHSNILYHGSREVKEALTSEMASRLARSLQQTNEFFAVRLARRAFSRFVLRISQFKDEFQKYVDKPSLSILHLELRKKMMPANVRLLRDAMAKQSVITRLSVYVGKHMSRLKDGGVNLPMIEFEAAILIGIIKHKSKLHKKEAWRLSQTGMQEITDDFGLLHDFHFGDQRRDLARLDRTYGDLFLTPEQKQTYADLQGTDEEKTNWLCETVEPKLQPLWYFMISLCRLLQTDDYNLDADEAYWLGLVDEVPGSGLPNLREMIESLPASPSTAPPPPFAQSETSA